MEIRNEKEFKAALDAIEKYKAEPAQFIVNKWYRWNYPAWHGKQNPPGQGGRLQCVYADKTQSVLRNRTGLHVVANNHLKNGDIVVSG